MEAYYRCFHTYYILHIQSVHRPSLYFTLGPDICPPEVRVLCCFLAVIVLYSPSGGGIESQIEIPCRLHAAIAVLSPSVVESHSKLALGKQKNRIYRCRTDILKCVRNIESSAAKRAPWKIDSHYNSAAICWTLCVTADQNALCYALTWTDCFHFPDNISKTFWFNLYQLNYFFSDTNKCWRLFFLKKLIFNILCLRHHALGRN